MKQPHEAVELPGLIPVTEHRKLTGRIQSALERADANPELFKGALAAYLALRRLPTHASALVRLDGELLQLPRDPVSVYLLPAEATGDNPRWLLVQYGPDAGLPAALHIIGCHTAPNDGLRLTATAPPIEIPQSPADFLQRARDIESQRAFDRVLVCLTMRHGRLLVTAAPDRAIVDLRWEPMKGERTRWERTDRAGNPLVLGRTRPYEEDGWRDDRLVGANDEPIELPPGLMPGHVYAADCDPHDPNRVFFGNSRARVHGIDLRDPSYRRDSPMLSATVRDLMVVKHPDDPQDRNCLRLLAFCNDGIAYLLDAPGDGGPLRVIHRQHQGAHLRQGVPVGDTIVALDRSQRLLPLRLGQPDEEDRLLDRFAEAAFVRLGLDSPAHDLWTDSARLEPARREGLATLALDRYLTHLGGASADHGAAPPFDPQSFRRLCDWLGTPYAGTGDQEAEARALLHGWLLVRLGHWIGMLRAREAVPGSDLPPAVLRERLGPLFQLINPPADAPDFLWTRLFGGADLLETWIERLAEPSRGTFKDAYRQWRRRLAELRGPLLSGPSGLHGASLLGSLRLGSRARHLRVVNAGERIITFIEYEYGLRLLRYPRTPDGDWERLDAIGHERDWHGLPRSLASGERLRAATGTAAPESLVFLVTDRGELRLYSVTPAAPRLRLVWSKNIDMDVRCISFGSDHRPALLLGGSNRAEHACILSLRLEPERGGYRATFEPLWEDTERGGSLRMLAQIEVGDPNDRLGEPDGVFLWAADRYRGILYRWRVTRQPPRSGDRRVGRPAPAKGPSQLTEQRVILRDRKDLHSFARDRGGRSDLVLCGGLDALTFAFDKRDAAVRWVICSGKRLTRSLFIPDREQWLLCTDHEHALLVSESGQPQGTVFKVGPVSTARLLDGRGTLILGNQAGRLLILRFDERPAAPGQRVTLPSLPRQREHLFYPLSSQTPIDPATLPQLLDAANGFRAIRDDPLCTQAFLYAVWLAIESAGLSQAVADRLYHLLQRLPNIILVPFISADNLRRFLLRAPVPGAAEAFLALMQRLWDGTAERHRDANLCHQTRILLHVFGEDFLEARASALRPQPNQTDSGALAERPGVTAWESVPDIKAPLFKRILDCLWQDRTVCPDGLWNMYRVAGLQLGQSARMWHWARERANDQRRATAIDGTRDKELPAAINLWLGLLWRLWGCPDTAVFRQRLRGLFDLGVPLLPLPWDGWLRSLTEAAAATPTPTPAPFTWLELERPAPTLHPLSASVCDQIAAAFPGDAAWQRWLGQINQSLQTLRRMQSRTTRVVWEERAELLALGEHLKDSVPRQFSLETGHGLLVLWLPTIEPIWSPLLEGAIAALDQLVPAEYLDFAVSDEQCWDNDRQLNLVLCVRNRYHSHFEVLGIDWDGQPVVMEPPSFIVRADTKGRDQGVRFSCRLETSTPNRLVGTLRLRCISTRGNIEFTTPPLRCEKTRDLSGFFRGDWTLTGRRLEGLLSAGQAFGWLDGHFWGAEERTLLQQQIASQYKTNPGDGIHLLQSLDHALETLTKVYSPDLLLDPRHPARMADSLHAIMHAPDCRAFSALALGIWQRTHPIPTEILAAIGDLLPSREQVEHLLHRLCPDQTVVAALDEGVHALPPTAMGAWCGGEPVYAHLLATGEVQTDELPDLYPNPAGLLDRELWERLRAVAPARIGAWLDIPVASLHYPEVFALFGDADGPTATPIDQAARILLGSLSGGSVERQPIGSVWRLNQEVVVLEQDYPCCYLVVGQADSEALAALCGGTPALWISIGGRLAGLPGATIDLSFNDAMQIVHAPNRDRALAEINRLRASVLKPNPSLVFRTENGFGDDRRISRHFYGRTTERETLEQLLTECDRDPTKGAAILVIGGRRMGKTSLKEWLDWYVRSQAARTGKQRLSIVLDWQALPKALHPDDLAHSFYQYARLALNAQRIPLSFQWTFPRKLDQHTQALEEFWNAVMGAKNSARVMPLFLFDETQHLLRHDLPELQLFAKIRNWATAGLFCLVATAYPRGRGSADSLNTLINDSKTPIYNMFTRVNLGPWTPDETWNFLFSRLSYLGIKLTRSLRGEVLRLTRGVPWIVHQLGLNLCRNQPSGVRVVSRDSWRRARNEVLHEIEAGLRKTVGTVADANDQEITKGQTWYRLPAERRLGKDRLWEALVGLASDHAPPLLTPVMRDYWPEPASFTVDDLHQRLGGHIDLERLHDALDSLTDTTVLTGDTASRDRFFFANNLLPVWAKWADGDE